MKKLNTIGRSVIGSALIIGSFHAYAGGFQISETSVSGLGRAFAGAGVAGDDVSDMFYNPGGMTLSSGRQFQAGLSFINSEASFSGSARPFGGSSDDGGESAAVPNFFYTFPESGNKKFGIGITAPFGLATQYDSDWAGRYHALRSELTTIDINPAFSLKISDQVSVGAGVSLQYASAELSQARFFGVGVPDGVTKIDGDNWSYGFNVGAMFTPAPSTRIGIGYRSEVTQEVDGNLTVTGPTGGVVASAGATAEVDLPETFYLSIIHSPNKKVDLLGSIRRTNWSSFQELRIQFDNGLPDAVTPENWEDSTTVSLGINYHASNTWSFRAGIAKDESPVTDEFRTARIPDSDRNWITFGASYSPNSKTTIDFSFANLSGDDAPIGEDAVVAGPPTSPTVVSSRLSGSYEGNATIFGIQFQRTF